MKENVNKSHQLAAGFPAEFGTNSYKFKGKGYHVSLSIYIHTHGK